MATDPTDRRDGDCPAVSVDPDRAVSEFTGVAILIAVTVLVTASVGLSVLVADSTQTGERSANFSFQYIDGSSVLIISFERGDQFRAGNLTVRGEGAEATWAVLSGSEPSAWIGPQSPASTVQVSGRNAYGQRVAADENVRVVYTPGDGNETVLQRWAGA